MIFSAEQIAQASGGRVIKTGVSGAILTDTRAIKSGDWFLAIVGERYDGHDFLASAIRQGAVGVVVDRAVSVPEHVAVVEVDDTTVAFQSLGRAARARLVGPVVAITGSSGKTTTRALVSLAVSPMGAVYQTQGNLNNHFGVPMTLLAAPETADVSVIEMGTSSPGEIAFLDAIATPDVRLVVNVGPAHLLELGGLAGVAKEKGALFDGSRPNDTVIVNLDDPYVSVMPRSADCPVVTYGRALDADVRIATVDVNMDDLSTVVTYIVKGESHHVSIPAPGDHIAHNGAAAIAVAVALGVRASAAVASLSKYESVGMRLAMSTLPNGVRVINDAYNANPDSVRASLTLLGAVTGRTVAVLGDMLELGEDEQHWHDVVAQFAGEQRCDLVVFVGVMMSAAAHLCDGAGQVQSFTDRAAAADSLFAWLKEGDTLLFKGSRGSRVETILDELKERICSIHY